MIIIIIINTVLRTYAIHIKSTNKTRKNYEKGPHLWNGDDEDEKNELGNRFWCCLLLFNHLHRKEFMRILLISRDIIVGQSERWIDYY